MIDPTIKIKEKKNSFTCKIKISKEEIESYSDVAELKKDFLESLAFEFDNFVIDSVESEEEDQVTELLETVQVCLEPSNETVVEDEEVVTGEEN